MGKATVGDLSSSLSLQRLSLFIHLWFFACVVLIFILVGLGDKSVEASEVALPANGGHPLILIMCPGLK